MKHSLLKSTTLLLGIFCLMLAFSSCDVHGLKSTGELITLDFDETDFHGLEINVPATVEVQVGGTYQLEITCEESAMPHVVTRVRNGILEISFDRNVRDVDHMKIVVTAPDWDHFELDGSGHIEIKDLIEGQTLDLDVSGSGSIHVREAHFDAANLEVSGSGDVRLGGSASTLDAELSGSGDLRCFDFVVNHAQADVSGSGSMQLHVLDKLVAEISGSGKIVYKGNPQVQASVSGSGSVKPY
jgi:hypothetical protein